MMTNLTGKPPRIAKRIFFCLSVYQKNHSIAGDVEEVFFQIFRNKGYLTAAVWYWYQCITAIVKYATFTSNRSTAMLKNYLKTAFRKMWRNRGSTFLNIAGLTLGLSCFIMIFLWVNNEISFDGFHDNIEDIHAITTTIEGMKTYDCPWALGPYLKANFPEVLHMTRLREREMSVKAGEKTVYREIVMVDDDFFRMFTFPVIIGDPDRVQESRNSAVLTAETAEYLFGDDDPIGKTVRMNNSFELIVTGITENPSANSSITFDIVMPLNILGDRRLSTWGYGIETFVLLDKNSDRKVFSGKIREIVNRENPVPDNLNVVDIFSYKKFHLYGLNEMGPVKYIYLFSAIAILILLIASINFMNMTIARSGSRVKEIGMRKVAGASRSDIIRQFIGEPVILAFAGFGLSLIIVIILLPEFNMISGRNISSSVLKNPIMLILLTGVTLLTGILSGSYPALYISRFNPVDIVKSIPGKGYKGIIIRRILIIIQFSASIALIIAAAVIFHQMRFIKTVDIGLEKDNIVVMRINNGMRGSLESIKSELRGLSNTVSITFN